MTNEITNFTSVLAKDAMPRLGNNIGLKVLQSMLRIQNVFQLIQQLGLEHPQILKTLSSQPEIEKSLGYIELILHHAHLFNQNESDQSMEDLDQQIKGLSYWYKLKKYTPDSDEVKAFMISVPDAENSLKYLKSSLSLTN
jgi:hypothetical protein